MRTSSRWAGSSLTPLIILGSLMIITLAVILALVALKKSQNNEPKDDGLAGRVLVQEGGKLVETDGSEPVRVSSEGWLTDFTLTSSQKESVSNATLLGKPYVISFFYSTCPSVCVRQNEKKKMLYDKFADQGIRFVSVSVDPEIDTPQRLSEYAERFNADPEKWKFLTGDMDYISRVGAEVFRIFVTRRGHPEQFIVVDAEGKIFGYYNWTDAGHFLALQQDLAAIAADPSLRASEVPRGREKKPAEPSEDEDSAEDGSTEDQASKEDGANDTVIGDKPSDTAVPDASGSEN